MQMLFGRHVGWCLGSTPLVNIEGLASGSDVVTVELETPFLLAVPVVKWENGEKEREGKQKKEGREE